MNAMKLRSLIPALVLSFGVPLVLPVSPAQAEARVSFAFFYDNLSPYGEWVSVGDYGYSWHPTQVDPDWSPYTEGNWAYTNDGWTWVSDEPWADVTYHYGRWVDVDGYGWCWVPGYEWGPAWVSWRSSDDYVGWAPLPPEAEWQPSVGFSVWTDSYYDIGPRYYRFCHVRDFCEPNMRRVVRPWRENISLMGLTINITNINYNDYDRRVFCGGPHLEFLRERTSRPVRHLRVVEEDRYERSIVRGDELRIFRPMIDRDRDRDRIRTSIARTFDRSKIDHGWRNSANDDERRSLRAKVQDQVRGKNPQNAPAAIISAAVGGLSSRQIHEKHGRPGDDRDNKIKAVFGGRGEDRDGPDGRGADRGPGDRDGRPGKGPFVDPRRPDDRRGDDRNRGPETTREGVDPRRPDMNGKDGDREDVRRGIPVPGRVDGPGKKGDDDNNSPDNKRKQVDPRKAAPDDDVRRGIPVPPNVKRPGDMRDDDNNNKRDGGTTRPSMPKIAPGEPSPSERPVTPKKPDEPRKGDGIPRPDRVSPGPFKMPQERPNVPDREPKARPEAPREQERPVMPKKMEQPRVEQRPPPVVQPAPQPQERVMPKRPEAPKVDRTPPVQRQVQPERPNVQRRPEAPPQVERRAPAPSPKPQAAPNRGHGEGGKEKKKDKD